MIHISDSSKFFELQLLFEHVPFTQSEGWYNYHHENFDKIIFLVDDMDDPKIAMWGLKQKIPYTTKNILRIEGECYKLNLNNEAIKLFYLNLTKLNYYAIEINSNNFYNIEYEIGLRRAGFQRPLSYFACPLTIELNLNKDFEFNRNWNRNVKKAIKNNLSFKEISVFSRENIQMIVEMFNEMADLKKLGYRLETKSLKNLLSSRGIKTFIVYDMEGKPLAGRIIHVNRSYASDVFAANSLEARKFGATFFIMEQIFLKLKIGGFNFFDFGRIPPSNHATDSIYVYKNASRGKKIQYNGEWVYYKNSIVELAVYFYKRFILKKQRY